MNGRWVAACAAAEAIGMTAAAGAARIATGLGDQAVAWGLAAVVLGGLVEGAALGLLQARALPAVVSHGARRRWFAATVVVAGVGWAAASAPAALADGEAGASPAWVVVVTGAAALGAVMGGILGLAQAWSVRRSAGRPRRWVLGSTVGWTCAMPVIFVGATSAGAEWDWPWVVSLGTATGLLAGTVLGLVTGPFLRAVEQRPALGTLVPRMRAL